MIINEIIIIGGGKSIEEGISLGLKEQLKDKFVITCNYAYKHFDSTFLCCQDRAFYKPKPEDNNPDIYEELKQLPLIVGINDNGIGEFKLNNTILLDKKYKENLTGMFALKLAMQIIDIGTIYLLGFDWNRRIGLPEKNPDYNGNSDLPTHYYNNIKHRGIGYVGYYENHNPDKNFLKFTQKKDVKIFNVSPESNINCFEKINYEYMFCLLNEYKYNQEELRNIIKLRF